eukprot:3462623-Prymnesium_polylepis.1
MIGNHGIYEERWSWASLAFMALGFGLIWGLGVTVVWQTSLDGRLRVWGTVATDNSDCVPFRSRPRVRRNRPRMRVSAFGHP